MVRPLSVIILILLGTLFGSYGGFWLIFASGADLIWRTLGGLTLIASGLTARGMWRLRRWALRMSCVLAVLALLLGFYLFFVMSKLNFELFPKATLLDKSMFVLWPLFLIFPVIWLIYFTRSSVKGHFQ